MAVPAILDEDPLAAIAAAYRVELRIDRQGLPERRQQRLPRLASRADLQAPQ
jgi:hypothetical protein